MTAVSAADGQIGGFIPECTPDGAFKPVQCHALTGFCWCVNHIGVRIVGTEERYKEPSCEGTYLFINYATLRHLSTSQEKLPLFSNHGILVHAISLSGEGGRSFFEQHYISFV